MEGGGAVKALELVVFEKEPGRYGREHTYNSPDGFWAYPVSHVDGYALDKRLTDQEMAAEYWRAKWTGLLAEKHGSLTDEGRAKIATVERFMSLPHYDAPTETGARA